MRSLNHLRSEGWTADKCEQKIVRPGRPFPITRDLFGLFDILAFQQGFPGVLGVQCTTPGAGSKHRKLYRDDPERAAAALDWIACGNSFVIHAWSEKVVLTKPGKGKKTAKNLTRVIWVLEERMVRLIDLEQRAPGKGL